MANMNHATKACLTISLQVARSTLHRHRDFLRATGLPSLFKLRTTGPWLAHLMAVESKAGCTLTHNSRKLGLAATF